MGDTAVGVLDTRMTLLSGMARSRIRKIAPELRRPKRNAKSERAPRLPGNGIERYYGAKLYAVSSRIFKQHRNILDCVAERDPGGAANGGDDEERAAMKANPNAKKNQAGQGSLSGVWWHSSVNSLSP
jgi:hypothetical protein